MQMRLNHAVLKRIVVVSLVEQRVYASCVNLQRSVVNDFTGNVYGQRGLNLLAFVRSEKHIQNLVCDDCSENAIEQVSGEVNHDVVSVADEIVV
jgi:hypothetical protein